MSFLSSIGKFVERVAIVPTGNVIASGISKLTGIPVTKQTQESAFGSKAGQVYTNILGAGVVTGGVAVASTIPASSYLAGLKYTLTNPLAVVKGAGVTLGATAGVSALVSSPKLREKVLGIPEGAINVGTNIGSFAETPTLENGLRIVKENPGLSAVALGALLLSLGYTASLIASIMNTKAIKENTKLSNDNPNIPNIPFNDNQGTPQNIQIFNQLPSSPSVVAPLSEVAPVGEIKPKAKKKKKKKAKAKPKKKKKTRRSKKKKGKNKSKNIKRRKNKR